MRKALTFLAAFVCLASIPLQAVDAWGGLGRLILRGAGHADEAAGAGRVGRTMSHIERLNPRFSGSLSSAEKAGLSRAYDEVNTANLLDEVSLPMRHFDTLMSRTALERATWSDRIALADDLPNVKIRSPPNVPGAGEALRIFTQARLREMLEAPFDVADLRVVVAGLADDAASSAVELAAFRRTIPAANFDDVGYLSRLNGMDLTREQMLARLRPYEGKTIVVVGHVPDGTGDFLVHLPGGTTRPLQISQWIAAAEEAGVNLIPIGCNSEKLGPIGARGLLNSRRIRQALRTTILSAPKTGKDFLRFFTSNGELELIVDPIEVKLVSNGFQVRSQRTQELVANLGLTGLRGARSAYSSSSRSIVPADLRQDLSPCLAQAVPEAFNTCVDEKVAFEEKAFQADLAVCRKRNLMLQPSLYARASIAARNAQVARWTWLSAFVGSVLLLAWMAAVSSAARNDEQDRGSSLGHIFNRWRANQFAQTVFLIGDSTNEDLRARRLVIYVLFALTAAFLTMQDLGFVLILIFGIATLMLVGTVVSYSLQAFQQESLVDLLVALAAGGILLMGYNEIEARGQVLVTGDFRESMRAENFTKTHTDISDRSCFPLEENFDGTFQIAVAAPGVR